MDLSMKAVADVLVGQAPIGVSPYLDEIRTTVGKTESYSVLDVVRAPSGMLPVTIVSHLTSRDFLFRRFHILTYEDVMGIWRRHQVQRRSARNTHSRRRGAIPSRSP